MHPWWFATCSTLKTYERCTDGSYRAAMAFLKAVMNEMSLLTFSPAPLDLDLPNAVVKGRSLHLYTSMPSILHDLKINSRQN